MKYSYTVQFTNYRHKTSLHTFICANLEELYDKCFETFGSAYANGCKLVRCKSF